MEIQDSRMERADDGSDTVQYPDWRESLGKNPSKALLIGMLLYTCAEIRECATGADVEGYISSFKSLPENPRQAVSQILSKAVANAVKFSSRGWKEGLLNRKAELVVMIGNDIPRRFSSRERCDFHLGLEIGRMHSIACARARYAARGKDPLKQAIEEAGGAA